MRVLLVEDDAVIREATQLALERHGFTVTVAEDGLTGLANFRAERPDVALLDLMLPGMNGVSLCRQIREEGNTPVIMLSARADPIDVVLGLEAGADDYVTKPFDSTVLVARIRAVVRRMGRAPVSPNGSVLAFGDLQVDRDALEVRLGARPVDLTPTELRLLLCFVDSPGTVLTRDVLLEQVWDYQWGGDSRVVDVHVQRLRTKIGQDLIETVRGFGYKLKTP
jgi:DNA-binding response OmpR family regulator